ncbi:MAG: hemoglobin/transferrin/lactoferrin receptor protein [Oleiphilaceae bacterium]|jgi:hemoglobin/transferrin/lactoferrin receptor protein
MSYLRSFKPFTHSMYGLLVFNCLSHTPVMATESNDDQPEAFAFTKILVSATRVASPLSEVSRPVSIVDTNQIESMQPQSVAQAIRYESNVNVAGGPRAGSQSVNIRGLGGSKVLQSVDGVRQVFESGHRPSYFLDPALLKSVEVIKGPASTLWGSGALGGVVSQNTVDSADLLKANQNIGGFIKTGFNDNNDQVSYVTALAGRTDAVDWLLSAYFRDGNDPDQGNGKHLENSAKQDHGVLAKSAWQLDENQAIKVSYRTSNEEGEIPSNGTVNVNGSSVFLINRETNTDNASIAYDLNTDSKLINGNINAYWNHIEMQESRISDGRGDSTELDIYGLSLKNTSEFNQFSLFYGLDGYYEDFETSRGGTNRPTPPEASTDAWGAYVNANFEIYDNFRIELGARYDQFKTEAKKLNSKQDDDAVSPSIAFVWQANDAIEFILRHDQAFRAPSSEELYTTGTHFCMGPGFCNTFVSNPDLKSESAANTELMARIQFEPNSYGGQLYVESSYFENKIDNFIEQIVSDPTFFPIMDPGNTTWINVKDAVIKGFEISTVYQQQAFSLKLAYGRSRGKDNDTNEDLTGIPADKFTADANYAYFDRSLIVGMRLSKIDAQLRTNYSENTTDTTYKAYSTTDFYTTWSPAFIEGVKLDLTINNLTDRYYRQAWQELYEPGREIVISTKYSF